MYRPAVTAKPDRPSQTTGPGPQEPAVPSESTHYSRQGAAAVTIEHRVSGLGHVRGHPLDHPVPAELLAGEPTQPLLAAKLADFTDLVRPALGRLAGPSHPHVAADPQL